MSVVSARSDTNLPTYRLIRKKAFVRDLSRATGKDAIFDQRVERRIHKLTENPKHHGYHAGGLIRCNWVAGVGDWAIIYEIDDADQSVTLLRFLSLDQV